MANKRRSLDVQLVAAHWLEIAPAPRRAKRPNLSVRSPGGVGRVVRVT
jgi:hypothetical protein